ncbi:MAG TPA: serine/threonine-protein kinase [Thermoanaerobaculia bacterium]
MTFGHYEVERVLGRGAMGTVYLARDRRIGRRVALKTISISPQQLDDSTSPEEFYTRLQREAEVVGSLTHPNIVALYEAGYEDGRIPYLAMELVEGKTLLDVMKEAGAPLELAAALRIIDDVLRGLAFAHSRGIVHRDIKPANVLIGADGVAKIADFGIARPQNSSLTKAGALLGTPNYMSPEQVLGKPLTQKADIFSTGVMLFEMLTGVKPFAAGDLTGTLHNILRAEVPHASGLNDAIPRDIGDVIARMVAKDPDMRPVADEAADALRRTESPVVVTATRSSRLLWVMSAAAALIIAIVIAAIATHSAERPAFQFTPAQLHEFDDKRHELDRADSALEAARYQEALDRYNAYLAKYPASTAAVEGRDRARQALDRLAQPDPAKTAKRHRKSRDEDISPAELLNRIRRVFKH